jgi:deazaflavin-dependent oxidoreductase (nitroreductase family)
MTPTILVTGATGTVGAAVVASLRDADDARDTDAGGTVAGDATADGIANGTADATVRAAVRLPERAKNEFENVDDLDLVQFDFEKPETWGPAFADVDRLFLVRPPSVGVGPVTDAVDAAVRVGVEHVAVLSVLGAEKNPLLPHRRIERHVEASGVGHTFLRASFFMQNFAEVHRRDVVDHDELFVPAGDGETSFVDARDVGGVAAAVLLAPDAAERAYDLTGPTAMDYDDAADVFSSVLGRPIEYADPSPVAFARRLRARGEPLPFVAVTLGVYATARFGFAGRVTDDVERVLGRPPRSLATFVRDYRDAFAPDDPASSIDVRPADAPPDWVVAAVNPILTRLLRSPLHSLVSDQLLLFTVNGRRSGEEYTVPVGYEQEDDALFVTTHHTNWWKNVRGGAPVTVHVRGERRHGTAEAIRDDERVAEHVHAVLRSHGPESARRVGVELDGDRLPTMAELRDTVEGVVLVRIELA